MRIERGESSLLFTHEMPRAGVCAVSSDGPSYRVRFYIFSYEATGHSSALVSIMLCGGNGDALNQGVPVDRSKENCHVCNQGYYRSRS
jgi:hypothetical protein